VQEILSRYLVRTRKLAKLAFQRRLAAEGNDCAADRQQGTGGMKGRCTNVGR
jgi:hypothetical protein